MTSGSYYFDRFSLDPDDRQLRRDGAPVELNARYLDALILLVRAEGKLVTKDQFLEAAWRGAPVTDEALTQCIRTLRRLLGDDAAQPRFIETVPKHGYRFIAPVTRVESGSTLAPAQPSRFSWPHLVVLGGAGTVGGGVAGFLGGLFYGFAGAAQPGSGAASALLVLVLVTVGIGLVGGAGVGFGVAAAGFSANRLVWSILGGALGGVAVGGSVKLIGLDAFNLLFGRAPADITGGPEGALLGGAVGLGAWIAMTGTLSFPRSIAVAGILGAAAGAIVHLYGGRLMAGSLAVLAQQFPDSRLSLERLGAAFGEDGFGPISQTVIGALEGSLFASCVVGAMLLARRKLSAR